MEQTLHKNEVRKTQNSALLPKKDMQEFAYDMLKQDEWWNNANNLFLTLRDFSPGLPVDFHHVLGDESVVINETI